MKFVPVVHCPSCNMPYTSAQLGFSFLTGHRYTVICGVNDMKGRKVGCGVAFDFEVVEVKDTKTESKTVPKAGFLNKLMGKTETVTEEVDAGSHLELRTKIRGA